MTRPNRGAQTQRFGLFNEITILIGVILCPNLVQARVTHRPSTDIPSPGDSYSNELDADYYEYTHDTSYHSTDSGAPIPSSTDLPTTRIIVVSSGESSRSTETQAVSSNSLSSSTASSPILNARINVQPTKQIFTKPPSISWSSTDAPTPDTTLSRRTHSRPLAAGVISVRSSDQNENDDFDDDLDLEAVHARENDKDNAVDRFKTAESTSTIAPQATLRATHSRMSHAMPGRYGNHVYNLHRNSPGLAFYRGTLHCTNVEYTNEFALKHSPRFMEVASKFGKSLEAELRQLPSGEYFATVIQIRPLKVGSLITFDVGIPSARNDEERLLREILTEVLDSGHIGDFTLSKKHFTLKPVQASARSFELPICSRHEFQCEDGSCIHERRRCDGIVHCPDGSDENSSWGDCNQDPVISYISKDQKHSLREMAHLTAEIENLGSATVLWIKVPDRILSIGRAIVVPDGRVSVEYDDTNDDNTIKYSLKLMDLRQSDSGRYELWIDQKHNKITKSVHLEVWPNNIDQPEDDFNDLSKHFPDVVLKKRLNHVDGNSYHVTHAVAMTTSSPHGGEYYSYSHCPPDHYECKSRHCLPLSRRCDTYSDCPDGDDEQNCHAAKEGTSSKQCREFEFRCRNGRCIELLRECDQVLDCPDGEDEGVQCKCKTDQWRCHSGQCIGEWRHCDGDVDCNDGSDEMFCPTAGVTPSSPSVKFCADGTQPEYSRQGTLYCWTSAMCPDHYMCKQGMCCYSNGDQACLPHGFECMDGVCLNRTKRCDGKYDCEDGSDELNCGAYRHQQLVSGRRTTLVNPAIIILPPEAGEPRPTAAGATGHDRSATTERRRTSVGDCANYEFRCNNHECVDDRRRCDGHWDCSDGSDERGCHRDDAHRTEDDADDHDEEGSHPTTEHHTGFPDHRTTEHHTDFPDDRHAYNHCPEEHYMCRSRHCLPDNRKCDDVRDCPDGDDEDGCDAKTTITSPTLSHHQPFEHQPVETIHRPNHTQDISNVVIDDENDDDDDDFICHPGEFECNNGQCISHSKRCNRVRDCADNSDEENCPRSNPGCTPGYWQCRDGKCVPEHLRCNGRYDCDDLSDEDQCRDQTPRLGVLKHQKPNGHGNQNEVSANRNRLGQGDSPQEDDELDLPDAPDDGGFDQGDDEEISNTIKVEVKDPENGNGDRDIYDVHQPDPARPEEPTTRAGDQFEEEGDEEEFEGDEEHEEPQPHEPAQAPDRGEERRPEPEVRHPEEERPDVYGREDHSPEDPHYPDHRPEHPASVPFETHSGGGGGGPGAVSVLADPPSLTVYEGRDASIICKATGVPYATLRWSKLGGRLPHSAREHDGQLTIPNAQLSDSGTYTCAAHVPGSNTLDAFEAQAVLNVIPAGPIQEQRGFGRCSHEEKTCRNGDCVKAEYICDGEPDCRDRSDELDCPPPKACEPNEFQCANRRCVQKMWLCDGDDDCGDRTDEQECDRRAVAGPCRSTEFPCKSQGQCIPTSFQCDQQPDCFDKSDEVGCAAPTVVEPPEPSKQVQQGETIILRCKALGTPVPTISWRKNWDHVCPPPRCTQVSEGGSGVLTIVDAMGADSGAYTCEALNVKDRVLAIPDCIVEVTDGGRGGHCNAAGSQSTQPDSRGQCRCKQFVTGPNCDRCIQNAFYLNEQNPQGCLRCFCSGITRDCDSTRWYRTQQKLVFSTSTNEIAVTDIKEQNPDNDQRNFRTDRGGFVTYTGDRLRGGSAAYWKLPQSFLGDKVTAYGGKLVFKFKFSGQGSPTHDPVVVIKGNEITLVNRKAQHYESDREHIVEVPMFENFWERENRQPADREHLLMALADLDSFLIKAQFVSSQSSASLGEVTLDIAVDRDTQQERAWAVEECRCPPGYIGLSCQDCAPGYIRSGGGLYLGTCVPAGDQRRSNCDPRGTARTRPDGSCECKPYVSGPNCDQCAANSFHLSDKNPHGCIPCFCAGVTLDCRSSDLYRSQERLNLRGHDHGVKIRSKEAAGEFRPREQPRVEGRGVTFSGFGEVPRSKAVYFELPEQLRGNRVTSYGGVLKYTVRYAGSGSDNRDPDVVIRGNDITLLHRVQRPLEPDRENQITVNILESDWQREDGQPTTREHLIMTLADIDTFLIKATYKDSMRSSSLEDVSLDISVPQHGQEQALAVELCSCPPGYIGTSCEDCASGYKRTGGGLYLGLCEPCNCYGHADSCDTELGYCLNCKHNTEGDQCELCKPGFTGDATRGTPYDCQPAAPQARCNCNGHSDDCDPRTGQCYNCQHNTEGYHCERCATGFYGDATRGTPYDCQECPCPDRRPCTADHAGRPICICPPGYTGDRCDRCAPGYQPDPRDPRTCRPVVFEVEIYPEEKKFQTVDEGDTITFNCRVKGDPRSHGSYNIAWTRENGKRLSTDASEHSHPGVLTIRNVKQSDSGQYICTGSTAKDVATDVGVLRVTPRKPQGVAPQPQVTPKVQTVPVGGKAEYECTASGYPPPVVEWSFQSPGSPLRPGLTQYNGRLIIQNAQPKDEGVYFCTASNDYGTNSVPVNLFVEQPTEAPTVRILPAKDNQVPLGEDFELRCVATGQPTPTVSWRRRDGQPFGKEVRDRGHGSLSFHRISQASSGEYECQAVNPVGQATETATVQTTGIRVTIYPNVSTLVIPQDQKVHLECEAEGTPQPQVKWIEDRGPVRGDFPESYGPAIIRGKLLDIERFSAQHEGKYICQATNGVETKEVSITLKLGNGGVYIIESPVLEVDVGETATARCMSTASEPHQLRWTRVGQVMPQQYRPRPDGTLQLFNFQAQDEGNYLCTAVDTQTQQNIGSHSIRIKIRGDDSEALPVYVIVEGPSVKLVNEGEDFDLKCSAPVTAQISWYYIDEDGTEGTPRGHVSNGVLEISDARREDAGKYKCVGTDRTGVVGDHIVTVIVQTREPVSQQFAAGAFVELKCPVHYVPDMKVTWSRQGGAPLPSRAVPDRNILRITNFQPGDAGTYECKVQVGGEVAFGFIKVGVEETDVLYLKIDSSSGNIAMGDEVSFSCWVIGDPAARIEWRKVDGSLPETARVESKTLTFRVESPYDAGVYRCTAHSKSGTILSSDAVLTIGTTPIIQQPYYLTTSVTDEDGSPETTEVHTESLPVIDTTYVGSSKPQATQIVIKTVGTIDTRLKCPAEVAGNVQSELTWRRLVKPMPASTRKEDDLLVFPQRLTKADEGTYVCTLKTDRGHVELYVDLVVADFIPQFQGTESLKFVDVFEGKSDFDISVSFRPESRDNSEDVSGLILHFPDRTNEGDQYLNLVLTNSKPAVQAKVGDKLTVIESQNKIDSGYMQTMTTFYIHTDAGKMNPTDFIKTPLTVSHTLRVDGYGDVSKVVTGTLNIGEAIYVGKALGSDASDSAAGIGGFVGCVSRLVVNSRVLTFSEASSQLSSPQADVQSRTELQSCQVCSETSCLNQGHCLPSFLPQGFQCRCQDAFTGKFCERRREFCDSGLQCARGSACIDDSPRPYCLCAMNSTGNTCEEENILSPGGALQFDGQHSFVELQRPAIFATEFHAHVRVKPDKLGNALLLYMADSHTAAGDYLALVLVDKSFELRYNDGHTEQKLRYNATNEVAAGVWYSIEITRTRQETVLSVFGGGESGKVSKVSGDGEDEEAPHELNIMTNLFVGGVSPYTTVTSAAGASKSFAGCISTTVTINNEAVDLIKMALDSANVESCSPGNPCEGNPCGSGGTCQAVDGDYECTCKTEKIGKSCKPSESVACLPNPCLHDGTCVPEADSFKCVCQLNYHGTLCEAFIPVEETVSLNGNSWLQLPRNMMPHLSSEDEETIELRLKTYQVDGLILWHGQKPETPPADQDYLALGLTDGFLEFSYELGAGPAQIVSRTRINDGREHRIRLSRKGQEGSMQVDDAEKETGRSGGILAMLNTEGDIYVGGLPGGVEAMTAGKYLQGYKGCALQLILNGKTVNFFERHVQKGGGEGGIGYECEVEEETVRILLHVVR